MERAPRIIHALAAAPLYGTMQHVRRHRRRCCCGGGGARTSHRGRFLPRLLLCRTCRAPPTRRGVTPEVLRQRRIVPTPFPTLSVAPLRLLRRIFCGRVVPPHAAALLRLHVVVVPLVRVAVLQLVLTQYALLLLARALPYHALPRLPLPLLTISLLILLLLSLHLLIFLMMLHLLRPHPLLALPAKLLALLLLAPLFVVRSFVLAPLLVNVLELTEIVFERCDLVAQLLILD